MNTLHNLTEDWVLSTVNSICDDIEKEGNLAGICTCPQCKLDAACYVLNRSKPHYIVSNRGLVRAGRITTENEQDEADLTTLIHEALHIVNENKRPNVDHSLRGSMEETGEESVYNIPAIVGRLFNGLNFAPIAGIDVSLYRLGELVPMKDPNWQNPCRLVANTEGVFSFWPAPLSAEAKDLRQNIAFTLRAEFPGMSALEHVFEIPAISGPPSNLPVSVERTFKLEDLYMFPPEEEEQWERL